MSIVQDKTDEPVKNMAVRWLLGQEANTVALFLIGIAIAYGGWHAMTIGIPSHLKTIQDGYERLDDRHEKSRTVDREMFKDYLDRLERRSVTSSLRLQSDFARSGTAIESSQ